MKISLYILMVCLWSCSNPIDHHKTRESINETFSSIKLIDTFENKLILDSANFITEAVFHPMYIGKVKDSLFLNYSSNKKENRATDWFIYRKPDSLDLSIFIDTSQIIGSINRFNYIPPPPPNYKKQKRSKMNYYRGKIKSHPVFIKNLSEDTLNLGFGVYIPLLIEAKDSVGHWKPIQKEFIYSCGTGLTSFYLHPNEIAISSCKLFKGNFKTNMRLKLPAKTPIYSNEFDGQMNYNQFDKLENDYN